MAIGTPVGLGSNIVSNVGNTLVITVGKAVSVGDIVVVGSGASAAGVPTGATDSRGNTYQVDKTDATLRGVGMLSAKVTTGLLVSDTITITFTNSVNGVRAGWAASVSGLATTAWADKINAASGTTTAWNGGATGALTQADEIVWASGYHATADTSTPATNFTELYDFQGTHTLSAVYRIVTATTTQTPGGTWATAGSQWDSVSVTYEAAGAAAVVGSRRPMVLLQAVQRSAQG